MGVTQYMYTKHSSGPKKFGRSSSFRAKPRFGGGFSSVRRPAFRRGGGKKRFGGDRIDASRFIKKGEYVEEKVYVPKHNFIDFPFNEQLHKNIARAG